MKQSNSTLLTRCSALAIILLSAVNLNAQKAEFGLRFMPTLASMDVKTSDGGITTAQGEFGYGVGAIMGYNFSEHIGAQGEVIYSSINQKFKDNDVQHKINMKYINIPLLFSLNTGKTKPVNLGLVAGPQIGLSAGNKFSASGGDGSVTTSAVWSVKKSDFGFAFGAGVDFGLNSAYTARLGLGYRGVRGLVDISDNSQTISGDGYFVLDRTTINTNAAYIGLSILF